MRWRPAILVCLLAAITAWLAWPPPASEEPGVEAREEAEAEAERPAGPMLQGRAPPPPAQAGTGREQPAEGLPDPDPEDPWAPVEAGACEGEVRVTDPEGNPVADVTIELVGTTAASHPGVGPWKTDRAGRAAIRTPAGQLNLRVRPPEGWWPRDEVMSPSGLAGGLSVVLRPGVALQGVVLDPSGIGVPSTELEVEWLETSGQVVRVAKAAVSGEEGRFRLTVPRSAGSLAVWASPPKNTWDRIPRDQIAYVRVEPGERPYATLRFELGETLEGYVVDLRGDPVLEGSVQIFEFRSPHRKVRAVELDGKTNRFRFRGLNPVHHWVLFSPKPSEGSTVAIYAHQETPVPAFDVRVTPTQASSLSGRVLGDAVAGLQVIWYVRASGSVWFGFGAMSNTDADGGFAFPRISMGDTRLFVRDEAGSRYALLENLPLPQADLDVPLRAGKTIRGRLEKPTGAHRKLDMVGASQDGLAVWGTLAQDGTFVIGPLPGGRWKLHWTAQGRTGDFEDPADVEAGARDVALPYPRGN